VIVATLDQLADQAAVPPRLRLAVDFLQQTDLLALDDGRVEIQGSEVFALVQSYDSRPIPDPPQPAEHSRYTFDPRDPVPTTGGGISAANQVMPPGAYDQRGEARFYGCRDTLPLSARNDVLVFQTSPLAEATEVTGPITVQLWASCSALDTDFTAKLIDVHPHSADYPAGFAQNLSDSIVRARYRNDREQAELLEPGRVYAFEIVLYPTSNLFGAGHRIRLDVSSSNFPRFDVNPNTGGPLGRERRFVLAENAVYHDPQHPSYVALPIIPASL
jgi:putative CocE/NonD family hydrolase